MVQAGHLSCCESSFPRLSRRVAWEVIKDLGFSAFDICVLAGYERTPPEQVVADPARAAGELLRQLEPAGLAISDVFAILSDPFEALAVNHPDSAVRTESLRQFHQIVEFARRLTPPGITILPGTTFPGIEPQASLELAATELQTRAEIAGEAGMRLSVEPHYQSISATPARTLELLDLAPDLWLTLDYSHFVFQGFSQRDVDPLIPRSRHLQLRPAAPGDMQTRANEGTIDFLALLQALQQAGYSGYLSLEYCWEEWMGLNDVDCVCETAVLRELLLRQMDACGIWADHTSPTLSDPND